MRGTQKNRHNSGSVWRLPLVALAMSSLILLLAVFSISVFRQPFVTGAEKKLPIYSVGVPEKKVAISFDTAWEDEHISFILDTLDQYEVKTTFFLVGFWVDKYPERVRELHNRGHEVQSHSATHPDMAEFSEAEILQELAGVADRIEALIGTKPDLFRPPFGSFSDMLLETAEDNGYKVIQWSLDSLDWKNISAEQITERVTRNIVPGDIVLFQNNGEQMEQYLPLILEKLQKEGYEIVPVGELIYRENYTMDHAGKQIPG